MRNFYCRWEGDPNVDGMREGVEICIGLGKRLNKLVVSVSEHSAPSRLHGPGKVAHTVDNFK